MKLRNKGEDCKYGVFDELQGVHTSMESRKESPRKLLKPNGMRGSLSIVAPAE